MSLEDKQFRGCDFAFFKSDTVHVIIMQIVEGKRQEKRIKMTD